MNVREMTKEERARRDQPGGISKCRWCWQLPTRVCSECDAPTCSRCASKGPVCCGPTTGTPPRGGAVKVAALYVERGGVYWNLPGVDPWDEERDARLYDGPHPVVAHPPCERWGRYATGGPGFRGAVRPVLGDDGGCFADARAKVFYWGGVLEHPADSHAWRRFGLIAPPKSGGWVAAGDGRGWTCHVEQGHYGHRARKATWLYAVAPSLPSLMWGPSTPPPSPNSTPPQTLPEGRRASRTGICQRMSRKQRRTTPIAFRDLLLDIARRASPPETDQGSR